jgi:hypothetical protein
MVDEISKEFRDSRIDFMHPHGPAKHWIHESDIAKISRVCKDWVTDTLMTNSLKIFIET